MKDSSVTIVVLAVCAAAVFLAWKLIPAKTTVTVPPTYSGIDRGLNIARLAGVI